MPQSNDTLFTIRGRVRDFRRGVNEAQVDGWINDRIKQAMDFRTYWSSMIVKGTLQIPQAYTTGRVSVTTGSNIVTGVGCAWPTNDAVNAVIPEGIFELGYQDVTPNTPSLQLVPLSTLGVTMNSILYVDAAGNPEAVPVVQLVNQFSFSGSFELTHNQNCTIWQSTLANRQFRLNIGSPIFTILAVPNANTLILDQPWGGPSLSASAYQIWQMYYTFGPNMQEIFYVLDQEQGLPLRLHTPVRTVNMWDPQRLNSGPPTNVVDGQPNANGQITSEIWPPQINAYQLQYGVYQYWPELKNDTDRPPWFINSTIFYHGALADALRYRVGPNDSLHNPKLAEVYEQRFMQGLQLASSADESKVLRELTLNAQLLYPGGANFDQTHDRDMWTGNF